MEELALCLSLVTNDCLAVLHNFTSRRKEKKLQKPGLLLCLLSKTLHYLHKQLNLDTRLTLSLRKAPTHTFHWTQMVSKECIVLCWSVSFVPQTKNCPHPPFQIQKTFWISNEFSFLQNNENNQQSLSLCSTFLLTNEYFFHKFRLLASFLTK